MSYKNSVDYGQSSTPVCSVHTTATLREAKGSEGFAAEFVRHFSRAYPFPREEKTSAQQEDLLGYRRGAGVGRGLTTGDNLGVGVGLGVDVAVGVAVGVGVTLGVGVGPPVTSRNAALIGPQVWKPWKSLTPRPCTKITWRPADRLAVFMVASTATEIGRASCRERV